MNDQNRIGDKAALSGRGIPVWVTDLPCPHCEDAPEVEPMVDRDGTESRVTPYDHYTTHVYDVGDFGAVGDGSTDDRAAILAAFTAANADLPATVFFPAGNYAIATVTDLPDPDCPHCKGRGVVGGCGKDGCDHVHTFSFCQCVNERRVADDE